VARWLERAGGPGGLTVALIALALLVGLILVASVFHFRRSREKPEEERAAVRRYFVAFFVLLLALPCGVAILASPRPRETLEAIGWTFGRTGLGLPLMLAGLPLAVLSGFFGARDKDLRKFYPLAKAAFADARAFAGYELSYVILYYLPYEFVFRGVLFLPLIPAIGLIPALAVQVTASTLLHIGHPGNEVLAAIVGGLVFGLIAYFTGSFFYTLVLHAVAGIGTDTFLFLGRRREGG
jgi:membrane protease YdiL (CAAX protease family)